MFYATWNSSLWQILQLQKDPRPAAAVEKPADVSWIPGIQYFGPDGPLSPRGKWYDVRLMVTEVTEIMCFSYQGLLLSRHSTNWYLPLSSGLLVV